MEQLEIQAHANKSGTTYALSDDLREHLKRTHPDRTFPKRIVIGHELNGRPNTEESQRETWRTVSEMIMGVGIGELADDLAISIKFSSGTTYPVPSNHHSSKSSSTAPQKSPPLV